MGIVNRRNAVVGWLVLKAGKRAAKKKAQDSVPSPRTGGIAAGAAAALGTVLVVFKRRKRGNSSEE